MTRTTAKETNAVDGRLVAVGDRFQLRFTRKLPHPPEKVWRALTEPKHLAAWFPTDVEGERAPGAAYPDCATTATAGHGLYRQRRANGWPQIHPQ